MADTESALNEKQWKYKIIQQPLGLSLSDLDNLGADGWAMCGFHVHEERDDIHPYLFMYYFKRPAA